MTDSKSPEQSQAETEDKRPGVIRKFGQLLSDRWPEYILEIVVVIIGITISFAINNYQNDANDRRLEQMYLSGLLEDISSDVDELEETITETKSVIESGDILLTLSLTNGATLNKEEFIRHVRAIVGRPTYVSKNSTFTALKSSGNFNLILDNQLKALLFEYDQQYQGLKSVEMAELQVTAAITGPYIIKSVPMVDSLKTNSNLVKNVDVKTILNDIEFINNIFLRRDNRQELFEGYTETLQVAKKIKEALQRKKIEKL